MFTSKWFSLIAFVIFFIFTARKRSLGQGNMFAPVCHSVHMGGLSHCMLGYTPPQDQRQAPPVTGGRHPQSSACWEIRATSGNSY